MQMGMSGGQAPPMEKRSPKDTRKIIARLSNFVFRWKKICAVLIVTILLTIVCKLAVPILVQTAINCLIYRNSETFTQDITRIMIALIVVFILNSVIEYIKNISAMKLSENLSLVMRRDLFDCRDLRSIFFYKIFYGTHPHPFSLGGVEERMLISGDRRDSFSYFKIFF